MTSPPLETAAPELKAQLLELTLTKLLKLEDRYDWPKPVQEAAWFYAKLCFYWSDEQYASRDAWLNLIRVATEHYDERRAALLGQSVRLRVAKACYELCGQMPKEIPAYRTKWFSSFYRRAKAKVQEERAQEAA